jgi:hypothetical protein
MLQVGVELYAYGFTITVLSDAFAQLGQRKFRFSDCEDWKHWVNQFKNPYGETTCYYFDDYDFTNPDYPGHLFDAFNRGDFVYLVNHRLVCNLRQFLVEFFAQLNIRNDVLDMSFILASAVRLFSEDDLSAPDIEYLEAA